MDVVECWVVSVLVLPFFLSSNCTPRFITREITVSLWFNLPRFSDLDFTKTIFNVAECNFLSEILFISYISVSVREFATVCGYESFKWMTSNEESCIRQQSFNSCIQRYTKNIRFGFVAHILRYGQGLVICIRSYWKALLRKTKKLVRGGRKKIGDDVKELTQTDTIKKIDEEDI